MGLYTRYGNNKSKELEGVWIEYPDGVRLLMKRAGGLNVEYRKALTEKMEPHQRTLKLGQELADCVASGLLAQAMAETVILDWEGVTNAQGKPLPFTVENCVKVFTDLPEFFLQVRFDADNRAHFALDAQDEDAKN